MSLHAFITATLATVRHPVAECLLLAVVILSCWLGVLGMWRLPDPFQGLHYISLPATAGMIAFTLAVFVEQGSSQVSFKTLAIALVLFGINSVVTHATARAFRARQLGHWEPLPGDPFEFVRDTEPKKVKP